jgi:hypothetical protein
VRSRWVKTCVAELKGADEAQAENLRRDGHTAKAFDELSEVHGVAFDSVCLKDGYPSLRTTATQNES